MYMITYLSEENSVYMATAPRTPADLPFPDKPQEAGDWKPDREAMRWVQSLDAIKAAKLTELKNTYDRALAGAVAIADPSPVNVALEAALWAAEDPEGLEYVRERLATQYAELAKEIAAAESVEETAQVQIVFAV